MGGVKKMKTKLIIAMATLVIAYPLTLTRGSAVAGEGDCCPQSSNCCPQTSCCAHPCCGQQTYAPTAQTTTPVTTQTTGSFTADQLDNLLAPIALYPDPLLAQILPASTFVDQIQQAAAWVKTNNNPAQINNQPWDSSVKALAGFPDVLNRMNEHLDWTTALGQAMVTQPNDVLASLQRLRQHARNSGALATTPQQTVAVDQGHVTIMPAQSDQVYVPQYDADSVYGEGTGAAVAGGLLRFGSGIGLGGWWNNGWNRGWDWGRGGIYNLNRGAIGLNRGVLNRNINRADLGRWNSVHRNTDWARHGRVAPYARTGAGMNRYGGNRYGGGRAGNYGGARRGGGGGRRR
jgi:hypothetical protein